LKLNETGKNIKCKLELALFRALHRTADISRQEKVDCCAVVQHDRTTIDLNAVVVQTVRSAFSETRLCLAGNVCCMSG